MSIRIVERRAIRGNPLPELTLYSGENCPEAWAALSLKYKQRENQDFKFIQYGSNPNNPDWLHHWGGADLKGHTVDFIVIDTTPKYGSYQPPAEIAKTVLDAPKKSFAETWVDMLEIMLDPFHPEHPCQQQQANTPRGQRIAEAAVAGNLRAMAREKRKRK